MPESSEHHDQQERSKKARKRAKRPGAPRSSKVKREKRAKLRTANTPPNENEEAAQKAGKRKDGTKPEEDLDNRIWVGGLPSDTDEQALLKHFKPCGPVRSIKLVRNSRSVFRGSSFISFRKASSLDAALELDGSEFKEKAIQVKKAAPPIEKPDFQVFVSGIPYKATEEVLRKDFGECGEIARLKMLQDNATGKFKGVIFVTYKSKIGVDAALKFNGTDYGGKTLVVRLSSEEKPPKEVFDVAKDESAEGKNGKLKGKEKKGEPQNAPEDESHTNEKMEKGKKSKRKQPESPDEETHEGNADAVTKTKKKKKKPPQEQVE